MINMAALDDSKTYRPTCTLVARWQHDSGYHTYLQTYLAVISDPLFLTPVS